MEKGFLKKHHQNEEKNRTGLLANNLILYAGICIILAGLFFMILNIDRSDSIIQFWLPFLISGIVLVFLSLLIRLHKEWPHH